MFEKKNRDPERKHHGRSALKIALMSLLTCVMLFSAVGGSLAWLMTKTEPIVNVFTYGDIRIALEETKGEVFEDGRHFKMTPGKQIEKDPKLTVLSGSEACWLFVKLEKSTEKPLDEYIEYSLADGWTELTGTPGVYYRAVDTSAEDQVFSVLKDDKVTVKGSVTQAMLQELNSENYPKLTFTGYAVQRDMSIDAINSAEKAWALITEDEG